jgi:hypothetical protein
MVVVRKLISELDDFSNNDERKKYLEKILKEEEKGSHKKICAKIMIDDGFVDSFYKVKYNVQNLFTKNIEKLLIWLRIKK